MNTGRLFTLLVAFAFGIGAQDPAQMIKLIEDRQVPNQQGFDPYTLTEMMDRMHVPGVSVAVIKDYKIHWAKAWGVADAESGAPVTPDTMFQAASTPR